MSETFEDKDVGVWRDILRCFIVRRHTPEADPAGHAKRELTATRGLRLNIKRRYCLLLQLCFRL
jgi:hypothetical protein